MLSFLLATLFVTIALAAMVSLADGMVRFRHAWETLKPGSASPRPAPWRTSVAGGAVVVLRPAAAAPVRPQAVLAAAA